MLCSCEFSELFLTLGGFVDTQDIFFMTNQIFWWYYFGIVTPVTNALNLTDKWDLLRFTPPASTYDFSPTALHVLNLVCLILDGNFVSKSKFLV